MNQIHQQYFIQEPHNENSQGIFIFAEVQLLQKYSSRQLYTCR